MNAKQAVAQRILELCKNPQHHCEHAANDAGIPPTTIYSILNTKSKNPGS